jgi:hypothetical protein
METTPEIIAFDRGVTPLLQLVLPEKAESIANFQPDTAIVNRIDELASKCTEGELTPEEHAEYVGYVRANKFLSILKRQAQRLATSAFGNE